MSRRPAKARALVAVSSLALIAAGTGAVASSGEATDPSTPARSVPFALVEDRDVDDRLPRPEDRYAMAGGCYTVEAPGSGWVSRAGGELVLTDDAATALPLHFQATRLGEYLLATDEGPDTRYEGAWWDVRGYLAGGSVLPAPLPAVLPSRDVVVADAPSTDAEWRVVAAGDDPEARTGAPAEGRGPGSGQGNGKGKGKGKGKGNGKGDGGPGKGKGPGGGLPDGATDQEYLLSLPARDAVLTVVDGALQVAPRSTADATPLALHHVSADDPAAADCAVWPEIETGASGKPEPVAESEASRARGFFEAHVHGMAYEFLGGELRCGQPWHPYGVEFALGDCYEQGNAYNGVLEVALAGKGPAEPLTDYDPVGWPTFDYWPQHDTLTHEQFYWRWLERAHAGGLRLVTNLLVDNTALCQQFPAKKNSCNEMDGVRLQAQRMFELQDYVDAQAGGPGEGWLRVVTDPAQARRTINSGRLAVVLGIEVSELFDCREVLDQPQCTEAQIDERLQEVYDMGVRQMELVNKFDNALSGVTGDGGSTGVVVNTGNRYVTGHWWDMQTCEEDHHHDHDHGDGLEGDEHDKQQLNAVDGTPVGEEGVDALAGRVLNQFGGVTRGLVAPAYGPGPHCNSRGLTDLGRHLIRGMIAKGMVFDPDHMSAAGQREALDLIENEIIPAERAAAAAEGRPAVQPSVISSHSWGNDVIYQRIYRVDGTVAPRTGDAAAFVRRWLQNRDFADRNAPAGYEFGMGYGADTNGLGGQPGPRREAATRVDYDAGFEAPIGGVRLEQQRSGLRTFDINTEGVPHYGLFADWFHELRLAADERGERGGGDAIIDDMLDGAEKYLSTWERAVYGGGDCVRDGSTLQLEDVHAALGLNLEGFLTAIGQPATRDGAAYTYCVEGDGGELEAVEVLFDAGGTAVQAAAGTALPAAATAVVDVATRSSDAPRHTLVVEGWDHDHDAYGEGTHEHVAVGTGPAGAGADVDARLTGSTATLAAAPLLVLAVGMLFLHAVLDRRRLSRA